MNSVEENITALEDNVDQGCDAAPTTCPDAVPDCDSLFPSCVTETVGVGADATANAGDGVIETCESVVNCLSPTSCFSTSG